MSDAALVPSLAVQPPRCNTHGGLWRTLQREGTGSRSDGWNQPGRLKMRVCLGSDVKERLVCVCFSTQPRCLFFG